MASKIFDGGNVESTIPSGQKIAVFSNSVFYLYYKVGYPNIPSTWNLQHTGIPGEEYVSDAVSADTSFRLECGTDGALYSIGADPSVSDPAADITAGNATFTVTGTEGSGSGAGGYVKMVGGVGGATGAGGEAGLLGGAGGATSGAGGAATVVGGAATNGNGAGGAVSMTGGAGQGTGTGGAASVTGGASGAGATGNGGAVNLTAGAAASTNGNGGSVVLTPGAKSGSGLDGIVRVVGVMARKLSRATISNAGTLTAAQIAGGVLYQDASGGSVTMTTLTGTQIAAAFPDLATGSALDLFCASNHASNTSTLAGGTDVTLVGSGAVTQTGGQFKLIKTAATTFDLVRVG